MKRLLIFPLLCLLLCSVTSGASQLIFYWDTDVVGGLGDGSTWANAYSSWVTLNTAEGKDITAGTGSDEYVTIYCRASSGTAQTVALLIDNWTTNTGDNYVEFIGTDFPADGIFDATKLVCHGTNLTILHIREIGVRFTNMQFKLTHDEVNERNCINANNAPATSNIIFTNCLIVGDITNSGAGAGIDVDDGDHVVTMINCIITGWTSQSHPADTGFFGFYCDAGQMDLYNCVAYKNYVGIAHTSPTAGTATNCILATNANDVSIVAGNLTVDYCASDDGDGTNALDAVSGDWDNELTDANNLDFTTLDSGNCAGGGTNDPSSGLYSTDIIGESYVTDSWSVGAYNAASSGVSGQVLIIGDIIDMNAIIYGPLRFDHLNFKKAA